MLYLKKANYDDIEKEYLFITNIPAEEHGFINPDFNVSKIDFKNITLPSYIDHSNGINLPEGWIPYTTYFLWNDNDIVGLFRIRHYLNEYLKNTDDVLVKILKHPTVTNAKIIDGEIKIDVDFEILAEVIGETKMQVTVFTPVTQEEDIDDLDIEVNEDFLG